MFVTSKNLRAIRQRLGLTQAAFAETLGITSNSLARQEYDELGISESVAILARLRLELAEKDRKKPKKTKR